MLWPLTHFGIEEDRLQASAAPAYWYTGRCPQTGVELRLPRTAQVEAIAHGLMQQLQRDTATVREGKMYGVLLVETPEGERRVLKAFSGLLNGQAVISGWVPPIPGRERVAIAEAQTLTQLEALKQELIVLQQLPEREAYAQYNADYQHRLQILATEHRAKKAARDRRRQTYQNTLTGNELSQALDALAKESQQDGIAKRDLKRERDAALAPLKTAIASADAKMLHLKQRRKTLSRRLQHQMHAVYSLTNFAGRSTTLSELLPGGLPTGTGDCAAPKLLHYAAGHHLKPLAMAEFWWGSELGEKQSGRFYGACRDRCQPIMGFLLSGLSPLPVGGRETHECELNYKPPCIKGFPERPTPEPTPVSAALDHPSQEGMRKSPPGRSTRRGRWVNPLECSPESEFQVWPTPDPPRSGKPALPLPRGDFSFLQPLQIWYQDEALIVVEKPSGLLSVPGRGSHKQNSVLSRLRCQLPELPGLQTVHRLDQDTSGLLVLATTPEAHAHLSRQFADRQVCKTYEAILSRPIAVESGTIELPLWGDPCDRPRQSVNHEHGKPSRTEFQLIMSGANPRVRFIPHTGRTHQLRVHAAHPLGLNAPILGDRLYGGGEAEGVRLHLHAAVLQFTHPVQETQIQFSSPVPF
ncbi:MAG: RluA family pseudouridine synthase [Spirulina sp. SIO3F2]|nr:RluA family pseudouridine synthase [Spirulina sp. SIO3F2]